MNKADINIVQLHKQEFKDLQASQLVLEFSGKSVNTSVVNTLRRLSLDYVPTYAFSPETINIEENTSIFDDDYMKLRLSQLTIPNIKVPVAYLPEGYWYNIDYADPERERHHHDTSNYELYINKINSTTDNINVTTNDVLVLENGKEINRFDKKFPLLLVQLRPKEVFKCHANAVLGVGKRSDMWAAAANSYYDIVADDKIMFTIETQGQIDEYDILIKSCEVLTSKLGEIKKLIHDKYNTSEIKNQKFLQLVLVHEDHTVGNIINEFLQIHSGIAYSGVSKPDLLQEEMVIKFMAVKENPIKPLIDTIDFVIELYGAIKNILTKLSK
jgi:DNA-directed RNA polymerase alpha subunit